VRWCQKVITQTHCTSGPSGPQLSAEYVWADGMGMLITGAMGCGCMGQRHILDSLHHEQFLNLSISIFHFNERM
jgi:hypothetical protein